MRSKAQSLALVALAYAVAIAVGAAWLVWGVHTGRLVLDTLIADLLATLVIFVFSRAYGNSSFYDAYWSVIPPVLLFYWWSQSGVAAVAVLADRGGGAAVGDTPDRELAVLVSRPAP